jgi:uncharacterized RDD family membrane protein YckC
MTIETYQKKQVVYPSILTRIITVLLDLSFLSLFITVPMQFISLYLFKLNFGDFAIANNLKLESLEDIAIIVTNSNFAGYLEQQQYIVYFSEVMLVQFVLMSVYFILCWAKFGTTLAKYIFKIKIMDYETHEKPKLYKCFIRYVSYLFFPISIIKGIFGKEKRTLHDVLAGTIVVKS